MNHYETVLQREAFGIANDNPCLRGGAPAGNGMAIIPDLVAKLPPFPFSPLGDEEALEIIGSGMGLR